MTAKQAIIMRFLALATITLLVACRDNAVEPPAVTEPVLPTATLPSTPTIAPTSTAVPWSDILEVSLSDASWSEGIAPQAPFALQFNQPMDTDSISSPLLFSPFVEGQFDWDESGTHLTYLPEDGFQPGQTYNVLLDSGLRAVSGLTFSEQPQWQIQILTAPRILGRIPGDRHLSDRRPAIQLTFDREMDQGSVIEALSVSPHLSLQTSWAGNRLILQTAEPLAPGTLYSFRLDRSAADRRGIPLADYYRWTYRTRDLIFSTSAPNESRREDPIIIQFNYAMDTKSVGQAIHFKPVSVGDLTWSEDRKMATFTPAAPLVAGTTYTVSFDEQLSDANGDPFPTSPEEFSFTTPPPVLRKSPDGEAVHPASTVEITFDRPVDQAATAAAFEISPAVAGNIAWRETTLIFVPDEGYLAENTDYTVTIDSGAQDPDGQPLLSEPFTWSFRTRALEDIANFGWGPNAQVVDVDGRRAIQFQLFQSSVANVTLELYQLDLAQFLDRYASGFRGVVGWEDRSISTEGTTLVKRWSLEPVESPVRYGNVQEAIIPGDVSPGLYILNLKAGYVNDQLILLLSRNSVVVKQVEGHLVAWVTDINGGPLADIEVGIYARDGELIASGRTGAEGVFRAEVTRDPQPLIVVAQAGTDITASGLSNEWRSSGSQWWGWWRTPPTTRDYAAYIYTDRPIYRPGQLVFFKAVVRQDDDAIIDIVPEGTVVTARIRDARNNVVQSFELATNNFGTVNGAFQLADGAMLGEYAVELIIGGESQRQVFKVEDYRKPDYQVTVITDGDRFVEGERVDVTVETAYFFGEPVPDADIAVNMFVLAERYWWDDFVEDDYVWYQSYEEPMQGRTDANGRFSFTFEAGTSYQAQQADWRSNLVQSIWAVEATVDDGSHQTVSGFAVVKVFNVTEKLGLDTNGYAKEPGQPFTVRANVQDIFDQPVSNRSLSLTLRRYNRTSGFFDIILQDVNLTSDNRGQASTQLTITEPGFYQLRLSGQDRRGHQIEYNTYIYAFSSRFSGWFGRSGALSINADKESYAPGETARLLIESGFSGPALLTFERGTVRREQLIELTAPVTAVDILIQTDDSPNIHVTVNAWQEQDTQLTENTYDSLPDSRLHVASVNLSVPVTNKSLTVTVNPDKETYSPREEATFTVRVTNEAGTPVSAEVSLAMVDEAIFALSDDLSGDPYNAFYYERENAVRTYDALALVRYLGGGRGGGGGGGDVAGNPRSDFPDTAEWFPVLHTDFNGEASVTVTLPDSLTSWRLTAKATTADTQVGQTFTNIFTKQEIVVRPILPRTLTAGDQVHLSAIVHNYSEVTKEIEVVLEADEALFSSTSSMAQTITLSPGGLRLVGWPLNVVSAGRAQLTVQANVEGIAQDAVRLPLQIRPLAVPDVTSQVGQFSGDFGTTIELPADALPMTAIRLELSRSIAGTLLEGLDYLTGFPYGCVEQTMSRALPNAVVGRALFQLGVSNPTLEAELPAKVNAGLQRLYGYQHNDGGWGWWYDDSSHDYQTAWVVFGLAVMADAGYEVDSSAIERGVDWLNENLANMDVRTRAYALYSMAVAGYPNLAQTLNLTDELDLLDTFSQAGLALALYQADQPDEALAVVDYLAETAVVTEDGKAYWSGEDYDGAYYQKTMASATRSTALALSAFSQIRPGHELESDIVRWLMAQRRQQGWGTTNETSYAILGLTDHLLATSYSESATTTSYTVSLNGETVNSGNLGRGEPAVSIELAADQLRSGLNTLRISQSGSGRLYYVINSRVYLAQEKIEAAGDVRIERTYVDAETKEEIEAVQEGQLVQVRLEVSMPENASYVIVEDSLPGGLDALNEGLNTSSHVASEFEPRHYWQEYGYNYKEIRGDRVSFFITEFDQGTRIFTYFARATHAGEFVAMPAEVSAMYDLTTWGRSASGRLAIIE